MSETNNNNNNNSLSSEGPRCAKCGSTGERLLLCGRCRTVSYCSKQCQKLDWKAGHKQACGTPSGTATAVAVVAPPTTNNHCAGVAGCPCPHHHQHSPSSPQAMYRTTRPGGDEWFMGIVSYNGSQRLVKLNDPAGELDSPGHDMEDLEFLTECFHYGGSTYPAEFPPLQMDGLFLRDFADKPADYVDSQQDDFDLKYPHGISNTHRRRHVGPTPQIRNGDRVRLMAQREIFPGMPPARERFWAQVISLTAFGMVTAICCNDLNSIDVRDDDFIAFPVTRIIGVKHGENWH